MGAGPTPQYTLGRGTGRHIAPVRLQGMSHQHWSVAAGFVRSEPATVNARRRLCRPGRRPPQRVGMP